MALRVTVSRHVPLSREHLQFDSFANKSTISLLTRLITGSWTLDLFQLKRRAVSVSSFIKTQFLRNFLPHSLSRFPLLLATSVTRHRFPVAINAVFRCWVKKPLRLG